MIPSTESFGAVKGSTSTRSVNGLAVHREMWETTGAKVVFPQKLSPRLDTVDVIVLVGQSFNPPGQAARDWLEKWLADKPGRTVLYFGRDFNAYEYYLTRQMPLLTPEKRADAEFVLARTKAVELNARLESIPESTFCDWFYLDASAVSQDYDRFSGPWADDLQTVDGFWPVGLTLLPPEKKWRSRKPSWLTAPANPNALQPANRPAARSDQLVQRSVWRPNELDTDARWNAAFRSLPDHQVLLAGYDGRPLVYRLTDREQYADSQILVVANGAPMLNGSLVDSLHRRVAEKLIDACEPADRVALLAYNESGLLISRAPEKDPRGAGLEFLTVWPISAITMPAALFCILLCVYLWPILGRARSLPKRSVSDFGLHVEALGRMLMDSGDLEFAQRSISEYYERVRHEPPPQWLEQLNPERPSPHSGATRRGPPAVGLEEGGSGQLPGTEGKSPASGPELHS